jgi:hypothetical protein
MIFEAKIETLSTTVKVMTIHLLPTRYRALIHRIFFLDLRVKGTAENVPLSLSSWRQYVP